MADVIYISSDDNEEEVAGHSNYLSTANINNISNTIASDNNNIGSRTVAGDNHVESKTVASNSGSQSRPIADCTSPTDVNTATPTMTSSSTPNDCGYETLEKFLQLCKPHIDNLPNLSMDELHKFALKSFRNSSPTFRNSKIFIDNLLLRVGQLENGEKHACLYLEEICSMLKKHKRKADEQDPGEVSSKKIKRSQAVSDPPERKQQRKKKRLTPATITTDRPASLSTTSPVPITSSTSVVQDNLNHNDNQSNSPVIILDSDTSPPSSSCNSILKTDDQRTTNKEVEDPSTSNNSSSVYVISDATPPQTSPKKKRRLETELIDISTGDSELSFSHDTASSNSTMSGTGIGNSKTETHPQSSETTTEKHPKSPETTTEKVLDSSSCSITKVDNCESPIIIIDPTPTCSSSLKQGPSDAGDKDAKLVNGNSSESIQHDASNSSSQAHCSSQELLNSESQKSQPQSNGDSQEFSSATLNPSIQEKIVKCEKYLKILHAEIKRLQELELDMDDLMLSDSSYIQECRLKAKVVDVYKRLCDLQSISVTSNLSTRRNIQVTSSRFPEINQKVQSYINKTKKFPDFASVKYLVKQASKQSNINLSRREVQSISVDMFQSVGKILKAQRIKDYTLFSGSHLTDNVNPAEDPAEKSCELKKKLEANKIKGQAAMTAELNKYVEKQNIQARTSSSSQQQPGTSTASNNNNLNNIPQDSDSDAEDPLKIDAESSEGEDDEEEEEENDDEEENDEEKSK